MTIRKATICTTISTPPIPTTPRKGLKGGEIAAKQGYRIFATKYRRDDGIATRS